METQGVTVVGFGVDEMPAFYNRHSGLAVDVRADSVAEIAGIVANRRLLGLQSATLVTVPVPQELELDHTITTQATAQATAEADELGIHGNEATPWLLNRMIELTDGKSMQANIALLKNNGFVAGGIAKALAGI
jgi:pseudouridine-5'-phosphate glycosidase